MGPLPPKGIVIYQKGSYKTILATIEECNKEAPLGDTCKIRVLGQGEILEAVEDLLTPTESPYQIPTNLEEVDKDTIGAKLAREEIAKLWSSEDLLDGTRGRSWFGTTGWTIDTLNPSSDYPIGR